MARKVSSKAPRAETDAKGIHRELGGLDRV